MSATLRQFSNGDVLLRQGDPSDCVLRVRSGEVQVLREVGDASIVLGHVRSGEWLGEMGVIEHRSRSATARAASDGEVEVLSAGEFLQRVSGDPALARDLILRLSVRLRDIEDKIAGELVSNAHGQLADGTERSEPDAGPTDAAAVSLIAASDALRARIGTAPIHIARLPFVVGRVPVAGEKRPARPADLEIDDEVPFHLSRVHFMIAQSRDRLLVSDLGSALGTNVNGRLIGLHVASDAAPLEPGDNRILAGGMHSPFDFVVTIGAAPSQERIGDIVTVEPT
jgi:CRP/FNR family transcriptional regulator, cyclic AMP receptor protein